tara:strand:+ start:1433 stop:1690 length:258 start_codon:yes stop_codon:yes gene_type:complete
MSESLENKATELVRNLSIEDTQDIATKYELELIKLGEHAVKPLKEFIATEGTDYSESAKQDRFYPTQSNYDSAKRVLTQIKSHLQ